MQMRGLTLKRMPRLNRTRNKGKSKILIKTPEKKIKPVSNEIELERNYLKNCYLLNLLIECINDISLHSESVCELFDVFYYYYRA